MSGREFEFDKNAMCDSCGVKGAWDIYGDLACSACIEKWQTERRREMKRRRCQAAIWKRDTYRRTGRGRGGFEMHYNKEQCSRAAVQDALCRQHFNSPYNNGNMTRLDWHPFMEEREQKEGPK